MRLPGFLLSDDPIDRQLLTAEPKTELCVLFCLSSCEVASGAFCCPKAEDVKRNARFQALATGLVLDNGALSALYREKKKADHTMHYHTCPPVSTAIARSSDASRQRRDRALRSLAAA